MLNYIYGIEFGKYKCFKNEKNTIRPIKNVNLITGKNNSGKSALLDIIKRLRTVVEDEESLLLNIQLSKAKNFSSLNKLVTKATKTCDFFTISFYHGMSGCDKNQFNTTYLEMLEEESHNRDSNEFGDEYYIEPEDKTYHEPNAVDVTISHTEQYLKNLNIIKLSAERDIKAEISNDDFYLSETGDGATNIIRKYLLEKNEDVSLINEKLLNAFNQIIMPDAKYVKIHTKILDDKKNLWEVFLDDEHDTKLALSEVGSGFKTILLVLLKLLLEPYRIEKEYNHKSFGADMDMINDPTFIFVFEELENNLHPSLQKRLYEYIYNYSIENNYYIFITSHSNIAINTFFHKTEASIFGIEQKNNKSTINHINNSSALYELFMDIGIMASDILQSNGIIWVEGPSDRIYLKKWLEVFCNCEYEEGIHYEFQCYGGRILSHYTAAKKPQIDQDYINMLLINKNAAIVMDSDRKKKTQKINKTKNRIKDEFKNNNMFCWITEGREIENYIHEDFILKSIIAKDSLGTYQSYEEFKTLNNISLSKVDFAKQIINNMDTDSTLFKLDLEERIHSLYKEIQKWNNY